MDIHKDCYSAIDLTQQDGPHRRETMKPEQLEIAQLKREVAKLRAERDILKNCPGLLRACAV